MPPSASEVIAHTKRWISGVVIDCNFCPFAAREMRLDTIHYEVDTGTDRQRFPQAFLEECRRLDRHPENETTLLIFPNGLESFDDYLDLLAEAESLLVKHNYEGIYQVASFHPLYCFADCEPDDAANYTNRSIYPMLHLLREDTVEKALLRHPNPAGDNIRFSRAQGSARMRALRDACLQVDPSE